MKIEKFNDLVGNPMIISLIRKGLRNHSFPQFTLFSGIYGIGKSSIAELVAKALTCDNPVDGEACGVCDTCKKNSVALAPGGSGISARIEKVNMARVSENKSMGELLKSTFQIIRTEGNYVKIFEEFDGLPENEQKMMLEETARIPSNVYIVLTTTHIEYILKEMESRCLTFSFGRLNRGETAILVDRVNHSLKLRPEDYGMIFQRTGAVPRKIVQLVEFLSANDPSSEEIDALLGNIGKEVFLDLFACAGSFPLYMETVDGLLKAYTVDLILEKLADFLTQLIFALEGKIYDLFPKKVLNALSLRDPDTIYKMIKLVESATVTEHGVQLLFMKVRRLLAPTMTAQEQVSIATVASSVKGTALPEEVSPLTKFKP